MVLNAYITHNVFGFVLTKKDMDIIYIDVKAREEELDEKCDIFEYLNETYSQLLSGYYFTGSYDERTETFLIGLKIVGESSTYSNKLVIDVYDYKDMQNKYKEITTRLELFKLRFPKITFGEVKMISTLQFI